MSIPHNILIEFFDSDYLENITAALCGSYSRILFICMKTDSPDFERSRAAHTEFLKRRTGIIPEFHEIEQNDFQGILRLLERFTDAENRFVFDVTGGTNLFIAAAGAFAGGRPDIRTEIIYYDLLSGRFSSSSPENNRARFTPPTLSIGEIVRIHSADIIERKEPVGVSRCGDGLAREIKHLWKIISDMPREWNVYTTVKRETVRCGNGRLITDIVPQGAADDYRAVTKRLEANGLLTDYRKTDGVATYLLRVPEGAEVLFKKGGNMLELYSRLAASQCGIFTDLSTGIMLDWDGIEQPFDINIRNEVDLLCVSGCIPFFISCKNTAPTNANLYEIEALAQHYCGKYTVKALISTLSATPAVRSRAQNMNIHLIENVSTISYPRFVSQLAALRPPFLP